MQQLSPKTGSAAEAGLGPALFTLLDFEDKMPPIDAVGALVVADYALNSLRDLGGDDAGDDQSISVTSGTLAGLAFSRDEVLVSETRVLVPVSESSERLGVLELVHPAWTEDLEKLLEPVVRTLVLLLVSRRRYTDAMLRTRRARALSLAARMQWSLLPPLRCTTSRVSVSGILEPAHSIGGDSFDFALNDDVAEFAIIDAVGHGMPAVLISTVTINAIRNARREGHDLERRPENRYPILPS